MKLPFTRTKDTAPQVVKENPVGHIEMGYTSTRPAPYELSALVHELAKHPLAFACVRKIAWEAAQAPLIAYNDDGSVNQDYTALLSSPNPEYSGSDWRRIAYLSLAGLGNFATTAFRGARGGMDELWPNRIDRMESELGPRGSVAYWKYKLGGKEQRLETRDVMHIRQQWIDMGQYGVPTACTNAANLKYHDGFNDWNNRLLDGAQGVSEILCIDGDEHLSNDQMKQAAETLKKFRLSGEDGLTGARALLNAKIKSVSRGVNPQELQAIEWFDRLTKSILNAYGVPSVLMDIGGGATYENQREARASFWEDTLIPGYVTPLADGLTRFFSEGGDRITVKPDLGAVPALVHRRTELMKCLESVSFMTMNEKRARVGMESIAGGDVIYTDSNKLPLGFDLGGAVGETEKMIDTFVNREGV